MPPRVPPPLASTDSPSPISPVRVRSSPHRPFESRRTLPGPPRAEPAPTVRARPNLSEPNLARQPSSAQPLSNLHRQAPPRQTASKHISPSLTRQACPVQNWLSPPDPRQPATDAPSLNRAKPIRAKPKPTIRVCPRLVSTDWPYRSAPTLPFPTPTCQPDTDPPCAPRPSPQPTPRGLPDGQPRPSIARLWVARPSGGWAPRGAFPCLN